MHVRRINNRRLDNIRMVICDVNNTLAPIGKPPTKETIDQLHELEAKGVMLVLASGRSVEYLKGFSRATGIHPLFIGDNGSIVHDFERYTSIKLGPKVKNVSEIKKVLRKVYGKRIMFVSQESSLLIEHKYSRRIAKMIAYDARKLAKRMKMNLRIGISGNGAVYISWMHINKGSALDRLKSLYYIKKNDMVAIGNDGNDRQLIPKVGLFIGVGKRIRHKDIVRFDSIESALRYVNRLC